MIRDCTLQVAVALGLLALCAGCEDRSNLGVVTGTITVDGAPPKTGSIAFFPADGKASTAGGEIIDGKYSTRVAFGSSRVEIRVPKVVGQKKLYDTPDSPVKSVLAESLPARYNDQTTLTIDVERGENQKDFALSTKPISAKGQR